MSGKININQLKDTIKNLDKETLLLLIETLGKVQKKKSASKKKKTSGTIVALNKKVSKNVGKKRGRPKKKIVTEKKVIEKEEAELDGLEDSNDTNFENEDEQKAEQEHSKIKKIIPKKRSDKGSAGRIEPFQAIKNRPNLFLKSKFFSAHKNDTKIDKKLNAGRKPTERGERNNLVEVECYDCGETFEVPETLIYNDGEKNIFKCGCAARK